MSVGQDIAGFGIDDHAGARTPELAFARRRIGRHAEEAAESRIVEERIAFDGNRAADGDVDDRGRDALDQGRETRLRPVAWLGVCGDRGQQGKHGRDGDDKLSHGA